MRAQIQWYFRAVCIIYIKYDKKGVPKVQWNLWTLGSHDNVKVWKIFQIALKFNQIMGKIYWSKNWLLSSSFLAQVIIYSKVLMKKFMSTNWFVWKEVCPLRLQNSSMIFSSCSVNTYTTCTSCKTYVFSMVLEHSSIFGIYIVLLKTVLSIQSGCKPMTKWFHCEIHSCNVQLVTQLWPQNVSYLVS